MGSVTAYVPPQRALPPDGPYGPDPHGRNGPRQGRRARKAAGIAAGGVLVLGALAQLAFAVFLDDGDDMSPSGPERTVTLPRSLDGGKLTLARDFSDEPGLALRREISEGAGTRQLRPVAGRYESTAKGTDGERLTVRGYNGGMIRPESTVHDLLSTLEGEESSGGERKKITPPGAGRPLLCEVMLKDAPAEEAGGESGDVVEVPVCAWADVGSVGAVLDNGPSAKGSYRSGLDAFAKRVSSLRAQVSVTPAGAVPSR